MTIRLNMPCVLQHESKDFRRVEATENLEGLDLHETQCPCEGSPSCDAHNSYMGRLSLAGWHRLAELYLMRHADAAEGLVHRWEALREAQRAGKIGRT